MPGLPYQLGENSSPTHSPPIGVTPGQNPSTGNLPHGQSGYNLPSGLIRPQPQLPQNTMAAMLACVQNGQSNGNTVILQHHINNQSISQISPLRIRINSPTRLNSTSSTSSSIQPMNDAITTIANPESPTQGATQNCPINLNETHLARMSHISQLHRPFEITESSTKKSKENS